MNVSESDSYPLTPIQQGMLVHHLRAPGSGVDIEQMVVELPEAIDPRALRDAWAALQQRHDVLRTSFEWEHGEPRQMVHAEAPLLWRDEDWRGVPPAEQASRFSAFLRDDRRQGFDPRTAPLSRFVLFRIGGAAFRFVWTFHHMLADGQSYPALIREVFDRYESLRAGGALTDHASAVPRYRTFIDWRQTHEAETRSKAEAFWREALRGFTAPTPLPIVVMAKSLSLRNTDSLSSRPLPTSAAPTAASDESDIAPRELTRSLPADATSALRAMAESLEVTLPTLIEAAWALVLSANSGEDDVLFGVTRACRRGTVAQAEAMVGSFINTLPVRVRIDRDQRLGDWLKERRAASVRLRAFEHTSLLDIQKWSEVAHGQPLFESLLVYTPRLVGSLLKEQGGVWAHRDLRFHEQTNFPLALFAYGESELLLKLSFDSARIGESTIDRWLGQLDTILSAMPTHAQRPIGDLPVLSESEQRQLVETWNATSRSFESACMHELFERQAARTPQAIALAFRDREITYDELNRRANRVARQLLAHGVGPDQMVGIFVERSIAMVVGLLGILKAGAAYVPLDPAFPAERLTWMLEDTEAPVVLTQAHLTASLPKSSAATVIIDDGSLVDAEGTGEGDKSFAENPRTAVRPEHLAYVLFTSGSSGRPKGVMVEHRQVANFFAGMDDALGFSSFSTPGVWLAVTSISFDISVLELFWTLARGFKIVIQEDLETLARQAPRVVSTVPTPRMDFSLFYFAADAGEESGNRYRLLLEGARYADTHGFSAVWTPERHFHPFGGLYPNPSVTSAAIAAITSRIAIRAGSVVLPLHDPIRVAEEWAVVDNLSNGRVGLSFASGWHVNDFALKPEHYRDRKQVMMSGIDIVRRLWRGESVSARNGNGEPIDVRIFPAPVQREPQIFLTSAGNVESFKMAGQLGANLLTNLLGQKLEDVAQKIAAYRQARRDAGHAGGGIVSLMLHTFVGDDLDEVRATVRQPFIDYLRTSTELVKQARWEFPAFATPGKRTGPVDNSDLTRDEINAMLDHAFNRYFETSGLFGTPEICVRMVDRLKEAGVDEIACLIDFGIASDQVLAHLAHLNDVRVRSNNTSVAAIVADAAAADDRTDYSIAAQIVRHGVTHVQCTPSLLRTLLLDSAGVGALKQIDVLMLGGEPLPQALVGEVLPAIRGRLLNMYGPTETTIWSSTAAITTADAPVTIGRPIANTQIYLVDRRMRLVPIGAAGELLIGGDGVTRGYLGRLALTGEKFVKDPFAASRADSRDGRLYRTGDLARYREDGRIEFLGRVDHQVKVRGHRIELGEIETALGRHESVRQAVVMARDGGNGGAPRLVAYVVPERVDAAAANGDAAVERWQAVWDDAYQQQTGATQDPTFDISGWRSSYTGDTLPEAEMREWVEHTVSRITRMRPRRVLEIGCGTGLLLFRIAPECEHYTGVDVSPSVIARLSSLMAERGIQNVDVHVGAADVALDTLAASGPFDAIVLNSVVQYFPDIEYLTRVLTRAATMVAPGGTIFVGDVRHLGLLEAFHTSVELARAAPDTTRDELRQRIRDRVDNDAELVIAPEYFHALRSAVPAIANTLIEPKRGRVRNELTRFRYDVSLRVGDAQTGATAEADADVIVAASSATIDDLRRAASRANAAASVTMFRGMVNPRLARDLAAVALLAADDGPRTAGDVRQQLEARPEPGIETEDVYALARGADADAEVHAQISWPLSALDRYDVTLRPKASLAPGALPIHTAPAPTPKPWREYVHQAKLDNGRLVQRWKQHLRDTLPDYMVPSAFVILDALPLTPNGKIDRKALPEPDRGRAESSASTYTAPASDLERIIADTWGELLGLDRVGTTDNFFDLGANSLLMVQAHAALRERLQRPLSLVDLFHFPSVGALAASLAAADAHESSTASALAESQSRAQARVDAMARRRQNRLAPRTPAKS